MKNDTVIEVALSEQGELLWVEPWKFKCMHGPGETFVRSYIEYEVIASSKTTGEHGTMMLEHVVRKIADHSPSPHKDKENELARYKTGKYAAIIADCVCGWSGGVSDRYGPCPQCGKRLLGSMTANGRFYPFKLLDEMMQEYCEKQNKKEYVPQAQFIGVDIARPNADTSVLAAIKICPICGTELLCYHGKPVFCGVCKRLIYTGEE